MRTPFPIGFWNYVSIQQQDVSAVRDWVDAGMTLAMSPGFGSDPDQIARVRAILDASQTAGIRHILCHEHAGWRHLAEVGESAYRQHLADALHQLGDHPAVFGLHVGDEPHEVDFPAVCRAIQIQKEMAPHLTPFCNLLPWHPGVERRVGYASWAAYLDAYAEQARPDLLCYDCYSQMNPDQEGWDMYFTNLREFQQASQRHQIPFWTTLLSVGHFRYRCPTEDDLRWQLNTALAHGAKGLLWFFFYMRKPHSNFRIAPIDEHWERSETFEWLSRVNRTFLKGPAAVVQDLTLQRVRHVGHTWGGVLAFEGSDLVRGVQSRHGTDLIISEFRHADGGANGGTVGGNYVMVVNNSQTDSTLVDLEFATPRSGVYRVDWMAQHISVAQPDSFMGNDERACTVRFWLAPGQMELFKVPQPVAETDQSKGGLA